MNYAHVLPVVADAAAWMGKIFESLHHGFE
jgi:hypothetical protein